MNNENAWLRYIPRCAECGDAFLPSVGPYSDAELNLRDTDGRLRSRFRFHSKCAPSLCKPGYIVIVERAKVVLDDNVLAKWEANQRVD